MKVDTRSQEELDWQAKAELQCGEIRQELHTTEKKQGMQASQRKDELLVTLRRQEVTGGDHSIELEGST